MWFPGREHPRWAISADGGARQRVEQSDAPAGQVEASGARAAAQHLRPPHYAQLGPAAYLVRGVATLR